MDRPEQHIIDTEAQKQFVNLIPSKWVCRPQGSDYGIDYEIEIFAQGQSQGLIFKVQLKGTKSSKINADGTSISLSISVKHARYYCREIQTPMVVVLADITTKKTYWSAPQIDAEFQKRLDHAIEANQKNIVFKFNTRNQLTTTFATLRRAIDECNCHLAVRVVKDVDVNAFAQIYVHKPDYTNLARDLHDKADVFKIKGVEELIERQNYEEAIKKIMPLIQNESSSVQNRFNAWFNYEKIVINTIPEQDKSLQYIGGIFCNVAEHLVKLTRKGPADLKCYSHIAMHAAQLHILAHRDYMLYINWKVSQQNEDPFWLSLLLQQRRITALIVTNRFKRCIRLLAYALNCNMFHILPNAVSRISIATGPLMLRLWQEGPIEAALTLRGYLQKFVDMSVQIAVRSHNWSEVNVLLMSLLHCFNPNDVKDLDYLATWLRERGEQIADRDAKKAFMEELNSLVDTLKESEIFKQSDIAISDEIKKRMYVEMARAHGIDIEDPADPFAKIVRIGLNDLNPERVLKNCRHLFVKPWGCSWIGQLLQLPTAGTKILCCMRRGTHIGGMSLDNIYVAMKCAECPNRHPHPAAWKWTPEWQNEQQEIYMRRFPQAGPSN